MVVYKTRVVQGHAACTSLADLQSCLVQFKTELLQFREPPVRHASPRRRDDRRKESRGPSPKAAIARCKGRSRRRGVPSWFF
eukprot:g23127.t1